MKKITQFLQSFENCVFLKKKKTLEFNASTFLSNKFIHFLRNNSFFSIFAQIKQL